jgi:hypothetical protein
MLAVSIVAAHAVLSGGQARAVAGGPMTFTPHRAVPADGTFALDGEGWPPFKGSWKPTATRSSWPFR